VLIVAAAAFRTAIYRVGQKVTLLTTTSL